MKFKEISEIFEKLEKTSKRLEKIHILRDFIENNKKNQKDIFILFDIIAGNYQRRINKKSIGISYKTIISVISFISKENEKIIEKEFEKIGDIGICSEKFLNKKNQKSLISFEKNNLSLNEILNTLNEISNITGTNSNKIKKEKLSLLFFKAKTKLEIKFLARLLIDDLRIGTSEGVIREVCVNFFFPKIIGIHIICDKCGYININLKECFKCSNKLNPNLDFQKKEISKKYSILEFNLKEKENNNLTKFIGKIKEEENIKRILRVNKEKYFIEISEPRELYNLFLEVFEKKYNLINSFELICTELNENLENVLKDNIILFNPIKSMLGSRVNSFKEAFEVVGNPAFADFKYDGLRVQIHNEKGKVKLFSRNLEDITTQFPEILNFIKQNFSDLSFVLDSECVGYDYKNKKFLPFQTLSKRIMKKDVKDNLHINISVKVFDILYLNQETLIKKPYKERREILENLFLNRKLIQNKID